MEPLSDLDRVCEMLGVTASLAPLGGDLLQAPSGIFLNHPEAGFSILVNLDMTPGRQRFTIAHGATCRTRQVGSTPKRAWLVSMKRVIAAVAGRAPARRKQRRP